MLNIFRKSQIAIEYCYRFKERHPTALVLWVHAGSPAKFEQSYVDLARKLNIPGWEMPNTNVLQLFSEWLGHGACVRWLMVIDNADDSNVFYPIISSEAPSLDERSEPLSRYLPKGSQGSIIITTRDKRLGRSLAEVEPVDLQTLDTDDAKALLYSKLPPNNAHPDLDAEKLLAILEFLPLAITQAAAFIKQNSLSISKYTEILQKSDLDQIDLLSTHLHDSRRNDDTPNSVISTWKMSFEHIKTQMPRAAYLLSLMSVLDRQGIPQSLLQKQKSEKLSF